MLLSNEQVDKYRKLYKARFGSDISAEQAIKEGIKLIRLMELIYKPMTFLEDEKVKKRVQQIKH